MLHVRKLQRLYHSIFERWYMKFREVTALKAGQTLNRACTPVLTLLYTAPTSNFFIACLNNLENEVFLIGLIGTPRSVLCVCVCVYLYIHAPKYNLFGLYVDFRADCLTLDNLLVCSSLGKSIFPALLPPFLSCLSSFFLRVLSTKERLELHGSIFPSALALFQLKYGHLNFAKGKGRINKN